MNSKQIENRIAFLESIKNTVKGDVQSDIDALKKQLCSNNCDRRKNDKCVGDK